MWGCENVRMWKSATQLDILKQSRIGSGPERDWLLDEAGQLRAIDQKSLKTARANHPITK